MNSVAAIGLLVMAIFACGNPRMQSFMEAGSTYKEGFVESGTVKLQYLDWGGNGEVLVLIPGLGDTPFLFDSLAHDLATRFHVISYSRRSHGRSETKEDRYDNAALVADLKLLLDSLDIARAHLLGWSMGGNEITELATLYPDRVGKLIYFEAGYDMSDGGFEKFVRSIPSGYLADESAKASLENYRKWYHRFWFGDVAWNKALEKNLQSSVKLHPDGSVATIPNDDVFRVTLAEAMKYKRVYENIKAPSLFIYTNHFLRPAVDQPAAKKAFDSIENNIVSPWREKNQQRIKSAMPKAVIVSAPDGSHVSLLFLSHDYLVKTITSFLQKPGGADEK